MKFLKYKKTIAAVLLLLAAGGALLIWRASSNTAPTYREARVTRGDIEVVVLATGVVQPRNRLEIKPPISGRMDNVLVQEGQTAARGQILAWMSSTERAALMDAARAKGPEELKRWEELYRPTPIVAPLAGSVILRNAEPGQTVTVQDAIFVMSDRLAVRASVDETDIGRVKLRQRARIVLDAYPNDALTGVVEQIAFDAKTVSNVTTYQVDVLPDKTPAFMRSGMTVNTSFILDARRDVLLVATDAVRTRERETYVLVPAPTKGEAPVERVIETGITDGKRTEVLRGLEDGAIVLAPAMIKPSMSSGFSNPLAPGRKR